MGGDAELLAHPSFVMDRLGLQAGVFGEVAAKQRATELVPGLGILAIPSAVRQLTPARSTPEEQRQEPPPPRSCVRDLGLGPSLPIQGG